jgi:hypothetical protein
MADHAEGTFRGRAQNAPAGRLTNGPEAVSMQLGNPNPGLDEPAKYEIKVPGRLDESWSESLCGMEITVQSGDDGQTITTLAGEVVDEAALQGLLSRLYTLGLRLLSVRRVESG